MGSASRIGANKPNSWCAMTQSQSSSRFGSGLDIEEKYYRLDWEVHALYLDAKIKQVRRASQCQQCATELIKQPLFHRRDGLTLEKDLCDNICPAVYENEKNHTPIVGNILCAVEIVFYDVLRYVLCRC